MECGGNALSFGLLIANLEQSTHTHLFVDKFGILVAQ